jgi:RNA polymerase sigma-70 factor, ECF subfamily
MTLDEELQLVEQAKENVQAFNKLYEYYFDRIYSFCLNRLYNKEASEDITSQVFLLAVEQVGKFDTSRQVRFGSWLYKVAHSKIIDFYRKNKKNSNFDFDKTEVVDSQDLNMHDDVIQKEHMQKEIAVVLKEVKTRYQEILTLRFFADLSIPEIAEVLELKPKQVSVLLHRALKAFRDKYKKKFPNSEIYELT